MPRDALRRSARAPSIVAARTAAPNGSLARGAGIHAGFEGLYKDALTIAQSKDRIPSPHYLDGAVFNFWQDASHVRGIWRRTTQDSYRSESPQWTTVLDLDTLAAQEKANWVYKGATLSPSERRALVHLSDGGEDAVTEREFDVDKAAFVTDGFQLPKGKSRESWQDDDTLLVAPAGTRPSSPPQVIPSSSAAGRAVSR